MFNLSDFLKVALPTAAALLPIVLALGASLAGQFANSDRSELRKLLEQHVQRITVERDNQVVRGLLRHYAPSLSKKKPPDLENYAYAVPPLGGTTYRHTFEAIIPRKHPA